eukprot:gene25148-1654_t
MLIRVVGDAWKIGDKVSANLDTDTPLITQNALFDALGIESLDTFKMYLTQVVDKKLKPMGLLDANKTPRDLGLEEKQFIYVKRRRDSLNSVSSLSTIATNFTTEPTPRRTEAGKAQPSPAQPTPDGSKRKPNPKRRASVTNSQTRAQQAAVDDIRKSRQIKGRGGRRPSSRKSPTREETEDSFKSPTAGSTGRQRRVSVIS